MTKQIEAVYERGVLRPVEPIHLPEGTRLEIILVTRGEGQARKTAAEILAEVAALPEEAPANGFSGRDHDRALYPPRPGA